MPTLTGKRFPHCCVCHRPLQDSLKTEHLGMLQNTLAWHLPAAPGDGWVQVILPCRLPAPSEVNLPVTEPGRNTDCEMQGSRAGSERQRAGGSGGGRAPVSCSTLAVFRQEAEW